MSVAEPYPGFVWADFEAPSVVLEDELDGTAEKRARGFVELADNDHRSYHGDHAHPWCRDCQLRYSGITDDIHEAARGYALASARWWLLTHTGPPPDDTAFKAALDGDMPPPVAGLLDRAQLDACGGVEWLIDGVLPRAAYAVLSGRDGTYKTFVALDWALSIATGTPWHGHTTEPGRVLYVATEGAAGIAQRVSAWEHAHRTRVGPDRFLVLPRPIDLRTGTEVPALADLVAERNVSLVVGDTLQRLSGGADETRGMAPVLASIDRIRHATTGGTVLIVAHTDKTDKDTRGASAIEDNADTVWRTRLDPNDPQQRVRLRAHKHRDAPTGTEHHLTPCPSGQSLVLAPTEPPTTGRAPGRPPGPALTASDHQVLTALARFPHGATAEQLTTATGLSQATIYRRLTELADHQLTRKTGTGRYTTTTKFSPDHENDPPAAPHPLSPPTTT